MMCNSTEMNPGILPVFTFYRLKIIKAFSVDRPKDLKKVYDYEKVCDLFLFDTKCEQYGGSGNQFDWSILHTYNGDVLSF